MYLYRAQQSKRIPMENGNLKKRWAEGSYNVSIEADISDSQLDGMTEFGCHLEIPQTDISLEKAIKYLPRKDSFRMNPNISVSFPFVSVSAPRNPYSKCIIEYETEFPPMNIIILALFRK